MPARYCFDAFEVDPARRRLLRDGAPVTLTAKAFETLLALLQRPGETIEKESLMRLLWPDTAVEEGNLTQQISTLRKALGETPDDHRFIVTVARRGYRFVAPVTVVSSTDAVPMRASVVEASGVRSQPRTATVGRDTETAELRRSFDEVAAGSGLLLCTTGEAGIGKSTLLGRFVTEIGGGCVALVGRCSERLAPGEPYLPVLEALEGLLRDAADPGIAELMAARAPAWYAQVAPLVARTPVDRADAGDTPAAGASQERQKREMAAFLLDLSRAAPVVFILDDLHWADVSTLDLLLYLTTRLERARLLIVAAYRPTELLLAQDPFVQSLRDLRARGRSRELRLGFLSKDDVAGYLAVEFPDHAFPGELAALLHQRTEGNPLFLVALARDLRDRGAIARIAGRWTLQMALSDVARDLPESIRSLIARTIDRLDGVDRQILAAGSVQGAAFDSAVVARALEMDGADVEHRLEQLERVHGLVRLVGRHDDASAATPNLRYAFVHVVYQNELYGSLLPTRRAALSGRVGDALKATSQEQPGKLAHQLGLLYEVGRRPSEAAAGFLLAAQSAVAVSASREAAALARRGLAIVSTLPPSEEQLGQELQLLITLGVPLAATTGYANPEVERTYTRASELCERLHDSRALFPVLLGLWVLHHVRADLDKAIEAANQLLALGERTGDARMLEVAHTALGYTRGHLGELQAALDHLERSAAFGHPSHHRFYESINALNPTIAGLCQQGRLLCLLGHPERAVQRAEEALALARSLGVPNAIGFSLVWSAYVHQLRGEPEMVRARTEEALALSVEHGLADVGSWAAVWHAWSGGDVPAGLATVRESLAAQRSFGSEIARPHQLALYAELLARNGEHAEAERVLDEGLAQAMRTGDRYYEPELHRLKGDVRLALQRGAADAAGHYRQAVEVARRHGSRLLENKAAASLTYLS